MIKKSAKQNLLQDLALGKISHEDLVRYLPEVIRADNNYIGTALGQALESRDPLDVEFGLALLRGDLSRGESQLVLENLCKLLVEDWHFSHEDIASLLTDIQNPVSVECLFKAATSSFDYLDYDETYQFARKCIKALSAVGTRDAIERIRQLSNSDNEIIKGYANKELARTIA